MTTSIRILFLLAITLLQGPLSAQEFPFWGGLEEGPYAVGFRDTVLLNTAAPYRYYGYSGAKPFFVSIWYPATKGADHAYMRFRDYMDYRRFTRYNMIADTLRSRYNNIYIRDAVCKNINTMQAIDFAEPQRQLFEEILDTQVFAIRNLASAKGAFPVVYYHHGAQSTSFDNVVFCEYMASQGYIVVSSNYLWPVAGKRNIGGDDEIPDMAFVVREIKKLFDYRIPFMIGTGHSWGGQNLLLYDTLKEKPFRQIVAFHTTIEEKSLVEARDWWPYLVDIFLTDTSPMTTPTIVIAPEIVREGLPTFVLFRENHTTPYTFVTVKTNAITHDGFITLGNLRAPFARKYQLEDSVKLLQQHRVYQEILRLTRELIQQKERSDKLAESFQELFGVENVN